MTALKIPAHRLQDQKWPMGSGTKVIGRPEQGATETDKNDKIVATNVIASRPPNGNRLQSYRLCQYNQHPDNIKLGKVLFVEVEDKKSIIGSLQILISLSLS